MAAILDFAHWTEAQIIALSIILDTLDGFFKSGSGR